jgi:hypothetical protein
VSVMTAHKILIAVAAVFFVLYALWEMRQAGAMGDGWATLRAGVAAVAAVAFAVYLRSLFRRPGERR